MKRIARNTCRTFLLAGLLMAALASAQDLRLPAPAAGQPPSLRGLTFEDQPFELAGLRGKVVLVVFWSTACAVCRDKMGELRANYEGWRGQPFELVLVRQDRRLQDVLAYEQILALTVPRAQRFPRLWSGQPGYADSFGAQGVLPATYLINKSGAVEKSYLGRIPAEAWDDMADLL